MTRGVEPSIEAALLSSQVQRLRIKVQEAREGSVELLFAQHVLAGGVAEKTVTLQRPSARPLAIEIASQGYAILLGSTSLPLSRSLAEDLNRLSQMAPFPADRVSFIFDPVLLIGVAAAVNGVSKTAAWDCRGWLLGVLGDTRFDTDSGFLLLAQNYSLSLLTGQVSSLPKVSNLSSAVELGFATWLILNGAADFADKRDSLEDLSADFLAHVLVADVDKYGVARAAVVLSAVGKVVQVGARRLTIGVGSVSTILSSFPACMERWRWDMEGNKRVRWSIDAEREVQDILWIMLRPYFEDLIYEDPLPKLGHASYRVDLAIPSLRLLIEVKFARKASDFKELEKQVLEDSVAYLAKTDTYREIIVFIYDDSSSSEHYDTTRRDLVRVDGISDVIIVGRPGRIPSRELRLGKGK